MIEGYRSQIQFKNSFLWKILEILLDAFGYEDIACKLDVMTLLILYLIITTAFNCLPSQIYSSSIV